MLGAICGDIIGSPYEKGGTKDYCFELISPRSRTTDDSFMTCAIALSVLDAFEKGTPTDFEFLSWRCSVRMRDFGRRHSEASYGGAFTRWLSGEIEDGYGSWGNGSAMRVSPVAWAYEELDDVIAAAKATAIPTHNSPEGIRGAEAVAAAIFLTRIGENKHAVQSFIEERFFYDYRSPLDCLRDSYTFDVSCMGSVPVALRSYHEASGFEDAVRLAVSMGGDSDTIAAIAGSIAEAKWEIPDELWKSCEELLTDDVKDVVTQWGEFKHCSRWR